MTPKLLQMYSLRSLVDALIATEEAELGMVLPAEVTVACPHPEDKRISRTTFGTEPSYKCLACGEIVQGQA